MIDFILRLVGLAVVSRAAHTEDLADSFYFEAVLDGTAATFIHKPEVSCVNCHGNWVGIPRNSSAESSAEGKAMVITDVLDASIPDGLFKSFPNLTTLAINRQNLRCIKPWDLVGAHLLSLNLSGNSIGRVDFDVFKSTAAELKIIDLSHNEIVAISNRRKIVSKFETIHLHHNRLLELPANIIPPSLRLVSLNDNQLRRLTEETFVNAPFLESIDVSNNPGLVKLGILMELDIDFIDVSNTSLSVLDIGAKMNVVKAAYNKITQIKFEN